jgi:predicted Zn-dependent protease
MAPRWIRLLAAALALGLVPAAGAADKDEEKTAAEQGEEVDYVALGARLLKDGHLDRAEEALGKADPEADDIDAARLFTLRGLINLKQGDLKAAKDHLNRAIDAGQANRVVYLYLAQAHYRLEEYARTIAAIDKAGVVAQDQPSLYTILARSHWELDHRAEAFATLDAAAARYPGNESFLRQKIFYLIELALYQKAAALGEDYLAEANAQVADYLAIGRALRQSGQRARAAAFLEGARLQYPDNLKLTVELAQVYLQREHTLAAAHLYERAAFQDPTYMSQAAELYRKAGKLFVALNLNARVPEPEDKLKQRLAIMLELDNYAMAAAMEEDLLRAGLLDNEDIRYALAYAQFKNGSFDAAEAQLQRLTRSDLFRKATELRKAMAECQDAAWKCY